MGKQRLTVFIGILFLTLLSACGQDDAKFVSEGVVEYSAVAVDKSNPMATMAPNKMFIKFKDDKSSLEMSAGMGLFSTSFISDPETKTFTQLVKLLNKKFSLVQAESDYKKNNDSYPIEIIPTKETKIIAGYKCSKVHIKLKKVPFNEFDVFYTKELNIKNPNFANPFYMIDGVMMEFQMEKFGMEMKFTATSVKKEIVEDATFEMPADYKPISESEMDNMFKNLQ
jgi:hypothetical protein